MLARLRKTTKENEGGFTLIELLVVMIIIGILAAIAIPAFLNQKKKAKEASAKSDATNISKEIAAALVDGDIKSATLTNSTFTYTMVGGATAEPTVAVKVSAGNNVTALPTAATSSNNIGTTTGGNLYCVAVTTADGVTWSASNTGLNKGACPA